MNRKVTVIVEGKEYIVEVGDLSERPIRATVNQNAYKVEVPENAVQSSQPDSASTMRKEVASPAPSKPASAPIAHASSNVITAPLPGDIIEVRVSQGDTVKIGDVVCVLEAMKMKNMIRSGQAGTIASVEVRAGQAVDHGEVLVVFG